jgi:hypothetical protein
VQDPVSSIHATFNPVEESLPLEAYPFLTGAPLVSQLYQSFRSISPVTRRQTVLLESQFPVAEPLPELCSGYRAQRA